MDYMVQGTRGIERKARTCLLCRGIFPFVGLGPIKHRWGHILIGLPSQTDHVFVKLAFEGAKIFL